MGALFPFWEFYQLPGRTSAQGPSPEDWLAAAPSGGHLEMGLVLGDNSHHHPRSRQEPRAQGGEVAVRQGQHLQEGRPPSPQGSTATAFLVSKVFLQPESGISAEDSWGPCTCLHSTGQEDLNFPSHNSPPSIVPGPGKWAHSSESFTQIQTHELISTLDLFSPHA